MFRGLKGKIEFRWETGVTDLKRGEVRLVPGLWRVFGIS